MRVGVASLYHESNTFIKSPTTLDDFRRGFLGTGAEIPSRFSWTHHEIMGFFDSLKAEGIEAVPLVVAWATPAGPIAVDAWQELLDLLSRELTQAGRLDGVLVAPHGAAVTTDRRSVDGDWVGLIRRHIGPDVPLIGTCDPHANLSRSLVAACDAMIAYRSNPHLDQRQRGLEAARMMARTLRGEIRPVLAAALPPFVINIERQLTSAEPCVSVYRHADAMLKRSGVLSNSIILGFPYADVPDIGCSTLVVTDGNAALAQSLADELARELWSRREAFQGHLIDVPTALAMASQSTGPICLLDMGDNIGGGSPGDGTVLAEALDRQEGASFVALFDPTAAETAIRSGEGAILRLSMGGKIDHRHGEPLEQAVTVRGIFPGTFTESEPRHGGQKSFDMGPTAIVETTNGMTIQLTSQRVFPVSLGQLTSCGLRPEQFKMIVAKGVHAPQGAYGPVCALMIRVNTPGVTSADLSTFNFRQRRKPMYPFETTATFP